MINLLPDEIKVKRKKEKYQKIGVVVLAVLLIGLVWTSSYLQGLIGDYQARIKELNYQLQDLETTKQALAGQLKVKNQLQDKLTLVNNLKDDLNYSWLIKDLNLIIPQQVWIEQLIIEEDNSLLISGQSTSNKLLLETTNRLEKYPYFEKIKITSSQNMNQQVNFVIKGQVREEL
ncbi:MAG: PilN domain-containing protein [Bacillota bacterium]